MQDEMAEDKKQWCEQHIDPEWNTTSCSWQLIRTTSTSRNG